VAGVRVEEMGHGTISADRPVHGDQGGGGDHYHQQWPLGFFHKERCRATLVNFHGNLHKRQ
jgi:hypothetical protein